MTELNLNNVTQDGTTTIFSGISSGIDSQATIEAILAAKRAPAVLIERKIDTNNQKLSDFSELKLLAESFTASLDLLRGPTLSGSTDIFKQNLAFSTSQSTATAPAEHVPSSADAIIGVSVSEDAVQGSHTVEVVQLATAHQIRSDAFTDTATDLTALGYTAGTFSINGQNVTLAAGDTLLDLQDKINILDTGATPTNVVASVITVSATESYLTLTSTETGVANTITIAGDALVTDSLGITAVGVIKTELTTPVDSIIRVDSLGVDITRSTNTITDVLEGVTLNLFKAEADTEIKIDIESDVNAIKTTIVEFVDAYNALRDFITDQRSEQVRVEDEDAEFGSLAFDGTLRRISEKLGELAVTGVQGIDPATGFASIAQIGIGMNSSFELEMDDDAFDDALLTNPDGVRKLFSFDFSTSDSRVYHFKHTGSPSNQVDGNGDVIPYYLNIGGTDADGNIISANFSDTIGAGTGSDPTVTIAGNLLKVTDPSAGNGLQLLYIGDPLDPAIADIEISFTRGIADTLTSFFDGIIGETDTAIEDAITNLQTQNADYEQDIEDIDARLEITRKSLTSKFLAMEIAMSRLNSLKDTLSQYSDSLAN